jgi:chemotaxis protein methyltransferase CheR
MMSAEPIDQDIEEQTFKKFVKVVHAHTGITLAPTKKMMLQVRLRPRMRELGLKTFESYYDYLQAHKEEAPNFIDLVTTNETYFYRTPRIWEHIENEFLPNWFQKKPGAIFNVWSAAASSGEEAHTLGAILQNFKDKHPAFQYQIFGTDISQEILSYAEKGQYSGRAIETFREKRPELFNKFLKADANGQFSAIHEIRSHIRFQQHNLFERPKFKTQFDLVLIRNVLIYFTAPDQEKVLNNVSLSMKPGAGLIIGESESLNRLKTPFSYKMPLVYELGAAVSDTKVGQAS